MVATRDCCTVVGWLLAVDYGGWRCLATASAAWDCVLGRRLRQRHRGTTWLAADRGGFLSSAGSSGAVHHQKTAQGYIIGRRRKRQTWLDEVDEVAAKAMRVGEATTRGQPVTVARLFDGDLGKQHEKRI